MRHDRFREHDFLDRLRDFGLGDEGCLVPIGDDAAVVDVGGNPLALALDTVVEGVHAAGPLAPEALARKVIRSNLSDLAAMGADPLCFLLSLTLPSNDEERSADELSERVMRALGADARRYGLPVVGGDTVVAPGPLSLAGAIVGSLKGPAFRRNGANSGDLVCVTGACGGSLLGRHADFEPRLAEAQQLRALGGPSAATDISDGLLRDADNIARASGVALHLEASLIPVHDDAHRRAEGDTARALDHALHDGEDFELLFTWPATRESALREGWKSPVPWTVIGQVTLGEGIHLDRGQGPRRVEPGGYDHGGAPAEGGGNP